jgi:hypothetical protein
MFKAIAAILFILFSANAHAQFLNNIVREVKRGGKNIGKSIEKGVRDAKKVTSTAVHDLGKATGKSAEDARKAVEKGLSDATKTAGKAGGDIKKETERLKPHLMDLGNALIVYANHAIIGTGEALVNAADRINEGKMLDAAFHLALDPLTTQEESAFLATQESGWLNTVGATAASAYGGPGGAAAYAAWQTYKATGGNADLALRAGIITGLTSSAMQGIGSLGGKTTPQMVKKAVLAGSVGGIAVAASGGKQDDIRDAFIMGGGMVIMQDAYKNFTGHPLDPKGATKDPICMSPSDPTCETLRKAIYTDAKGNPQIDMTKFPRSTSFVGIGADLDHPYPMGSDIPMSSDQSPFMRTMAKIPGMNAMGLMHDKWVVTWALSREQNVLTIFPAIVLTYAGSEAGLNNKISSTVSTQANNQTTAPQKDNAIPTNTPATSNTTAPNSQGNSTPNTSNGQTTKYYINGDEYYASDDKLFNRWGMIITDNATLKEFKRQKDAAFIATNNQSSSPYFYDFSNPNTTLNSTDELPSGFNGFPNQYQELPPIELASKYANPTQTEKYGFENMYVTTHPTAPVGSFLYIRNLQNAYMVRVFVIGKTKTSDIELGISMRLSEKAYKDLAPSSQLLWVETEYEDVTINSMTLLRNATGNDGKLLFNNLRNGKWALTLRNEANTTVYRTPEYKNDLKVTLGSGNYYYSLIESSIGQTYREYTGKIVVK